MVYVRNQPVATDDLSVSQPILLGNTNAADDSFNIDHYPFSILTGQTGKHNKVTTPAYVDPVTHLPSVTPPTPIANEPVLYAFQQTAPIGVIQYSNYYNTALATASIPTPLTHLQSQSAPIVLAPAGVANILDFTGINTAFGSLYAGNLDATNSSTLRGGVYEILWNASQGCAAVLPLQLGNAKFIVEFSVNTLRIRNSGSGGDPTFNNVYWTLVLERVQ